MNCRYPNELIRPPVPLQQDGYGPWKWDWNTNSWICYMIVPKVKLRTRIKERFKKHIDTILNLVIIIAFSAMLTGAAVGIGRAIYHHCFKKG